MKSKDNKSSSKDILNIKIGDNINILGNICSITKIKCLPLDYNQTEFNDDSNISYNAYEVKLICYKTGGFIK